MAHQGDGNTNYNWYTRNIPQRIGKETGRFENKRIRGDSLNYSIVKIGQNTEKSPVDLRTLAVTQTPVKDHHPTLSNV